MVHACRYCGLYDESIAAHAEARRLDPNIPTSFDQTLLLIGDTERILTLEPLLVVAGADDGLRVIALGLAGRREEARKALLHMPRVSHIPAFRSWTNYLEAWLDRRPAEMLRNIGELSALKIQDDPEAIFRKGWLLCEVGDYDRGLEYIRRAVAKGYFVAPTLRRSPHFDALRGHPTFQTLFADAEAGRQKALETFLAAGGGRLLGDPVMP